MSEHPSEREPDAAWQGEVAPQDNRDAYDIPTVKLGPHFELHPVVFPVAAAIVLGLIGLALMVPDPTMHAWFGGTQSWIGTNFGWLYVISLTGFLLFAVWLALGRFGRVRLGKDDERPEFNTLSWFAMLFSAGMGIGLVFWAVAEPIYHYNSTPPGLMHGMDKSRVAMAVSIFHWGLHPWALYAVVGLALAYFGFRRGMPLSFRSLLHPIFGDRIWGRLGDAVDVLTVVATLVGVATSLGLGAQQVNAGLAFLFNVDLSTANQVYLIVGITLIATVSVVLGLSHGIRRLSEVNMVLAAALMVMIIVGGGVVGFFASTVDNVGAYLQMLPFSSFRTGAYNEAGRNWLSGWTVFYWAWWIAWSPFVGMFIARVSRGRTIREFVTGVMLVPTGVGIIWLTAFGSTTLRQHNDYIDTLEAMAQAQAAGDDASVAELQQKLTQLPVYFVQQRTDDGTFALSEDGKLVGQQRGIYEQRADGTLVAADGTVVTIAEGTIHTLDGEPYTPDPEATFDGTFAAEPKSLTAVAYLDTPVLNEDRTIVMPALPTVLFALIDGLFKSQVVVYLAATIATLCIVLFFVTSSDSASMVIDIIASGGNPDPPVGTRLFWAVTEGAVAAGLLVAGGLQALQAASITAALPFTVILLLACIGLVRALHEHETPMQKA